MLREHIAQSGQSQREFARAVGISEGYLSLIIAGAKIPRLRVAVRIEELTGGKVTAAMLARGNGEAGAGCDLSHASDPATPLGVGEGNPVSDHSPELRS
jgi:transcriptional regulator with XRE-family HTH domain